jgi:hypothetical protein
VRESDLVARSKKNMTSTKVQTANGEARIVLPTKKGRRPAELETSKENLHVLTNPVCMSAAPPPPFNGLCLRSAAGSGEVWKAAGQANRCPWLSMLLGCFLLALPVVAAGI